MIDYATSCVIAALTMPFTSKISWSCKRQYLILGLRNRPFLKKPYQKPGRYGRFMINSILGHFDLSQLVPFYWSIRSLAISHLYQTQVNSTLCIYLCVIKALATKIPPPPLHSLLVLNFDNKTSKIFSKCNHLHVFGRYLGETHFVHKSRAVTRLKIKEKQKVIG